MNRFVAGAVAGLMLVSAGLFWWQGHAEQQRASTPAPASSPSTRDEALTEGADNAFGVAPPLPPGAREEDREAKRFDRYDFNRDDIITRTEMMSSRTKDFKKLDRDGNNLLSFEEWAVKTSDRFAGADANGDKRLTRAEFATTAPKSEDKPKCRC